MKVHLEWGAEALNISGDAIVIVDCLSFSSAVSIGCMQGAKIYPYLFRQSAKKFADRLGLACAGKRDENGFSLSPSSLSSLHEGQGLVLPSPNGSTLSLFAKCDVVLAGALRNAGAIASYLDQQGFENVVFVAAGERWISDGSLRPAFEDLIACGAMISLMGAELTPEAQASVAAFKDIDENVVGAMLACQSGLELCDKGWQVDVALASEVSVDACVPRLSLIGRTYGDLDMDLADGFSLETQKLEIGYYCCV